MGKSGRQALSVGMIFQKENQPRFYEKRHNLLIKTAWSSALLRIYHLSQSKESFKLIDKKLHTIMNSQPIIMRNTPNTLNLVKGDKLKKDKKNRSTVIRKAKIFYLLSLQ